MQAFLIGAFFFLFAFQTFDLFRKSRNTNPKDREEDLKKILLQAEGFLEQGRKKEEAEHPKTPKPQNPKTPNF